MTGSTARRSYRGATSTEREERRREQLLNAGRQVFSEDGWAGATVQRICRTAGLSPRYFYEQFASREALFMAVCERIADEVEAAVRDAVAAPDRSPGERADAVLAALASYFSQDPRTVRVALVESLATPDFRTYRGSLLASFSALAAQLMRPLHPDPRKIDRRALELSAALLSGAVAEALMATVGDRPLASERELLAHLTKLYAAAAAIA